MYWVSTPVTAYTAYLCHGAFLPTNISSAYSKANGAYIKTHSVAAIVASSYIMTDPPIPTVGNREDGARPWIKRSRLGTIVRGA